MKIKSISRTISGYNHDNFSATADLEDGEDPIEAAKELNMAVEKMLHEARELATATQDFKTEKQQTVSLLESALQHAKDFEIPF